MKFRIMHIQGILHDIIGFIGVGEVGGLLGKELQVVCMARDLQETESRPLDDFPPYIKIYS